MNILINIFRLFRAGESVANPTMWKTGQITVTLLVPFLVAFSDTLREVFGLSISITDTDIANIALGIITVANVVLTTISSKTVGLPSKTDNPSYPDIPKQ